MGYYLLFRSGSLPNAQIVLLDRAPKILPSNSLIIAGGARRPDMHPFYAADWEKGLDKNNMLLIAEAPFPLKPWRNSKLKIYRARQDIRDQKLVGRIIY